MGRGSLKRFICALIAALAIGSPARAGGNSANSAGAQAPIAKPGTLPDDMKLNMMIRSTVIAVNQANKTNNYTVLRDLGSPRFKEANSVKKLENIFAALRKTKFDLSPVLFFTPQMMAQPAIADDGMLRLTGYFDTVPQRLMFDFLFEDVKGDWMIYGLNIATQPSPALRDRGATSPPTAD